MRVSWIAVVITTLVVGTLYVALGCEIHHANLLARQIEVLNSRYIAINPPVVFDGTVTRVDCWLVTPNKDGGTK